MKITNQLSHASDIKDSANPPRTASVQSDESSCTHGLRATFDTTVKRSYFRVVRQHGGVGAQEFDRIAFRRLCGELHLVMGAPVSESAACECYFVTR